MTNCSRTTRAQRSPNVTRTVSLLVVALATLMPLAGCDTATSPSAAVAGGGITSLEASSPQGQGKPTNTPASLTLADRVGDAITSDGGGTYSDGVGGVLCQLLSGGQLSLNLENAARNLNFDLNGRISGSGPTGTLSDHTKVAVSDIAGMAVGSSKLTRGIFNTSVGQFNFDSAADSLTNSVSVTRISATTWTVETGAGDVAVLVRPDPNKPNKSVKVGYYHLPFKLTGVTQ